MDLSVSNYTSSYAQSTSNTKQTKQSDSASKKEREQDAVVYEKSSDKKTNKTSADHAEIIKQLKAEQERRTQQLVDLVNSTLNGQGKSFSIANGSNLADIFKNIKVDADTIAQAKKDIAEDGYWGVEQTSDRLVSMAQALAGGDKSKADELISAIQKGFNQATKSWGEDLPDICKNTLKTTIEKMEKWRDSTDE